MKLVCNAAHKQEEIAMFVTVILLKLQVLLKNHINIPQL